VRIVYGREEIVGRIKKQIFLFLVNNKEFYFIR
jgi:hypothetical protein